MPRGIPDWVFPGTQVDDGNVTWTIESLARHADGRVLARLSLLEEEDGSGEVRDEWVDDLVANYISRTPEGSVSTPIDPVDVMVVPVDWSSPPQRWHVQAIVVEDCVRMVLAEMGSLAPATTDPDPAAEAAGDHPETLAPFDDGARPSAYQRLRT